MIYNIFILIFLFIFSVSNTLFDFMRAIPSSSREKRVNPELKRAIPSSPPFLEKGVNSELMREIFLFPVGQKE